jgi:hypothetical protein
MTQRRLIAAALACGFLGAGCSVEDKVDATQGGGDDGDGTGSDYSGGQTGGDDGTPTGGDDTGGQQGSNDPGTGGGGNDISVDDDAGANVLPTYPTQHPRIYISANKVRLEAALAANTPAATRFRAVVDRWVSGSNIYGFQIWNAALMGALTGDSKYCAKAVSAIDAQVADEEAKIAAGAQPTVAGNSYLHVGDLLGDVVLTYDWCFANVTASQKTRWLAYANQTVWNVWHPAQATWGGTARAWTGWATNDPSDNYFYSFLRATMLLGLAEKGEDPQGDTWITQFRETKFMGQLVPTFKAELAGGGSREGTAYGVTQRGLFHLYDLWYATTGEKLQAKTPHARQSIRAFMHQVVPTLDRIAPTGDQPRDMTAEFFDYQRNYLQELIALYPHDPIAPRAQALLDGSNLPVMARPELLVYDFLYDNSAIVAKPLAGLGTSYYASGIGQIYSRSGWDKQATWINLTAGAYTQSHAHQDQGALLIYKEGWLSSDAVIQSSNGIIQETGSHSLVRIDNLGTPVRQMVGTESKVLGLHEGDGWLYASTDVTPAYKNNAAVGKVQREVVFLKPNVVVVYDRVATGAGTTQTWELATPTLPSVSGTTATISGTHSMTVQRIAPENATTSVKDLSTVTGYRGGYRLESTAPGGDVRFLHVLSIDGAALSTSSANDSTVTVNMANGKTATVAFNRTAPGATLTYNGAVKSLGATVDRLAE